MGKDESIDEQLSVTHQMGGMIEFEKTGVYPEKLIIHSLKHEHVWRLKVRNEIQIGTLKINKEPIYNYRFDGNAFFFQILKNGLAVSDWIAVENMSLMMID